MRGARPRAYMHFEIDPGAPAAPSEQLADQVRFAIAGGRLGPGDRLPSVRKLAAAVLINPNTVSKAYRELEREGALRSRRGLGVFVAQRAQLVCVVRRDTLLRERVRRVVHEAQSAGLDRQAIWFLVAEALGDPDPQRW